MVRPWSALPALLAVAIALPAAAAAPGCTQETLNVRGAPVTIGYCVSAPPRFDGAGEVIVPVMASYGSPGGSFARPLELRFVAGERTPRIMERLSLAPLGMPGVLHLTLTYSGGLVWVEGALLTPGAITVK